MIPIKHPILFQKPTFSEHTEKPDDLNKNYIAFPDGHFRTLEEVRRAKLGRYTEMKGQFLGDILRLKSLLKRLIRNVSDNEITIFHNKIINDLRGEDEKPSSLISYRETRYYLHNILNQTERFLKLEAENPHQADKFPFNRDGLCALFLEFTSGIDNCLDGSSTRIQSAFTSLENSRDPQRELLKIRHGLLEYGVKSFLAKERANGQIRYLLGNEVHTHNKLYNIACEPFGLEPLNETPERYGSNATIINRFNRILPSLMPEFKILHKLTEVFYQDFVLALKKRNKENWLTHPVPISELKSEIIDGIKEDFITPINLRFKTANKNTLDLWDIIKQGDRIGLTIVPIKANLN
ncbi:hypothetical protein, partial [Endozoicomonas sp. ONNA2]|uniref:hypothetical protein n=1 Tax=Endozoicomonas sp. ONNA2 TaxID=2828741 RepID=UPI002148047B